MVIYGKINEYIFKELVIASVRHGSKFELQYYSIIILQLFSKTTYISVLENSVWL
jgi:hypothetical protein